MKSINKTFMAAMLSVMTFLLPGCEKDDETANVSFVTTYPEFAMAGDRYLSIVQGETYSEAGVTATEEGQEIPVTVSGEVDTSTPGIYDITYSAVNSDNFSGSVTRTVAVLPEPEQEGVDISGSYNRSGVTATVTKLAPGFYLMSNVYGSPVIGAYIITTNGTDLLLPEATLSGFGPLLGTGTLEGDVMTLVFSLTAQGIVDRERVWERAE